MATNEYSAGSITALVRAVSLHVDGKQRPQRRIDTLEQEKQVVRDVTHARLFGDTVTYARVHALVSMTW